MLGLEIVLCILSGMNARHLEREVSSAEGSHLHRDVPCFYTEELKGGVGSLPGLREAVNFDS